MAYWLYWRVYELKVRQRDFENVFGPTASLQRQFGRILWPLVAAGLMTRSGDDFEVTRSGAYWIHRVQNEYSLNYINRLWGTCQKQPWPEQVSL
jgi:oxygen-independent coproporphyrinogen-3 oxidase